MSEGTGTSSTVLIIPTQTFLLLLGKLLLLQLLLFHLLLLQLLLLQLLPHIGRSPVVIDTSEDAVTLGKIDTVEAIEAAQGVRLLLLSLLGGRSENLGGRSGD